MGGDRLLTPWSEATLFPLQPLSPSIVQLSQSVALLFGCLVLFVVGLADDWKPLPAGVRLVVQLAAAVLLTGWVPGFRLAVTGSPAADTALASLWLVAMTNAFNFLDNMNGLSSGIAAIAIAALAAMGLASAHLPAAGLGLLFVGACAGFLLFNFPHASIFMGDAGGLMIGFAAGGLALLVGAHVQSLGASTELRGAALLPACCLAVPLYDLTSVVLLRLRRRRAPWTGDTNHVSHRLVAAGLRPTDAVLVLYVLTALSAATGIVAMGRPGWLTPALALLAIMVVTAAAADLRRLIRPA